MANPTILVWRRRSSWDRWAVWVSQRCIPKDSSLPPPPPPLPSPLPPKVVEGAVPATVSSSFASAGPSLRDEPGSGTSATTTEQSGSSRANNNLLRQKNTVSQA
jgi:hypothetical protein